MDELTSEFVAEKKIRRSDESHDDSSRNRQLSGQRVRGLVQSPAIVICCVLIFFIGITVVYIQYYITHGRIICTMLMIL